MSPFPLPLPRAAEAVLCCESVWQVQQLVRQANAEGRTLHPYSTGLNWGYGGREPVQPGSLQVDLSRMNRILNADAISASNPVALVQPGVTQGQLADFLALHHPSLTFNVTGSARGTSLLGNSLDRGVGYLGPRREDLFGLEVVTGRGDLIYTGFRRLGKQQPDDPDSPLAHVHPYGLGPMLDGLFSQGNFGIVTSACFRLMPRAPKQAAVSLALRDARQLGAFIDGLAALKREGVMTGVTHIGDRARTQATLSAGIERYLSQHCGLQGAALGHEAERVLRVVAPHEWASLGGVSGSAVQVREALRLVRGRMAGLARMMVVTDERLALGWRLLHPLRRWSFARAQAAAIDAIRPLHGLASGQPTDVAIDNLLCRFGRPDLAAVALEDSPCGVLFINPALPMQGAFVQRFVAAMRAEAERHGQRLYMTLNIETPMALVAVVNLLFDRRVDAEVSAAKRCADALHRLIQSEGLSVYRARTDMMAEVVDERQPYWRLVRDLKQVLDPNNIISPGRYNLP
jgi:4-cresol dehydrogenase (hydroxylating) flavoprotein subunit